MHMKLDEALLSQSCLPGSLGVRGGVGHQKLVLPARPGGSELLRAQVLPSLFCGALRLSAHPGGSTGGLQPSGY